MRLAASVILALSAQPLWADTPREAWIRSFDYGWDMRAERPMSRPDAPFFGQFTARQIWSFYYCGTPSFPQDCLGQPTEQAWQDMKGWFFSEARPDWTDSPEPVFVILPYALSQLQAEPADWAFVPICSLPFNTLWDGFVFSKPEFAAPVDHDQAILEAELAVARDSFTTAFLDDIGADGPLRTNIARVGLFTQDANFLLHQAWQAGRLARPAIVFGAGECGDGGLPVMLRFAAPTARLQLIPEFDYRLCQMMQRDPWDADQCPHVRDQLNENPLMSGRYRARITRTTGEVLLREIEVNGDQDTDMTL